VASEGEPVAAALLDAAAGADLLVMGGYGRTRSSELVPGGATRQVLAQRRLPILISHCDALPVRRTVTISGSGQCGGREPGQAAARMRHR
jgi:hypothetical protein